MVSSSHHLIVSASIPPSLLGSPQLREVVTRELCQPGTSYYHHITDHHLLFFQAKRSGSFFGPTKPSCPVSTNVHPPMCIHHLLFVLPRKSPQAQNACRDWSC